MRIFRRRLGLIGPGLVAIGLLAVVAWAFASSWHPAVAAYPLQGADVSEEQGYIDWPVVRAGGADFAYLRATRGTDMRDTLFAANWAATYAAGLRRGASHSFVLCRLAADQARNFMVTVPRVTDALPVAVVIDDSPECGTPPIRSVLIGELQRFIALVERHTGERVLLRVPPAIEARYRLSTALDRSLWATGGYFPPTYFTRPWRMWQANAARRIDGAERAVGWDVVAP